MKNKITNKFQKLAALGALSFLVVIQSAKATPPTFVEGDFDINGPAHAEFTITWEPSTLIEGPTAHINSHTDDGSGDGTWSETYYTIRFQVGRVHAVIKRADNNIILLDYGFPLYMNGSSYSGIDVYQASFEAINTSYLDNSQSSHLIQSFMTFGTNLNVSVAGLQKHKVYSAEDIEKVNWTSPDQVTGGRPIQHSFFVYDAQDYVYAKAHRDDDPT